jgi:mannose-6-phosphate isomerase-like protein (cupin superfamily)
MHSTRRFYRFLKYSVISLSMVSGARAQEPADPIPNKKNGMVTSIRNAEQYEWGAHCEGWHLLKNDSLSVIQEKMPPGASEQLHYHTKARQVFYILTGTAYFEIDGENAEVHAGQSVHIPNGVRHRIFNKTEATITFLVISAPKAQGDRVNIETK